MAVGGGEVKGGFGEVAPVEGGEGGFVEVEGFPVLEVGADFDVGGEVGGGVVLGEVVGEVLLTGSVFDEVEGGGVGGVGVGRVTA